MNKLLLFIMMMGIWTLIGLQQAESELAMRTLFEGKSAVNRAVHAAAQQLDQEALADGVFRIDAEAASAAARRYLESNLRIDGNGDPLENAFLRHRVRVLAYELINDDYVFPYTYRNEAYKYEVTLRNPGVIMIVRIVYPQAFQVTDPIEWEIKGAAELVIG